jgi:hypothetical protein
MEVAAGSAAEVLDLVIDPFGQVGGAQLRPERSREAKEDQIMGGALLHMFDPGFVVGPELFQQGAELGLGALGPAGGTEFFPEVFKGGVVLGAEVAVGIALEVDGAELVVGLGEDPLKQAG